MTCDFCGSVVGDVDKHVEWHRGLEAVEATADDALAQAEDARNTLYQNNIST